MGFGKVYRSSSKSTVMYDVRAMCIVYMVDFTTEYTGVEMKQVEPSQPECTLNFVRDGKYSDRGWSCTPSP